MSVSDAISRFNSALRAAMQGPFNAKDQRLVRENGQWGIAPTAQILPIATNDAQVDALKQTTESFETVFNDWLRISRGSTGTDDSNLGELEAWALDVNENRIRCTANTVTLVGFISPERLDTYTIETVLKSTDSDNDHIGLCLAYAHNEATGKNDILTATRTMGGAAPLQVDKNRYGLPSASRDYAVAEVGTSILTAPSGGWNSVPSGVRLKIVRTGDIITVQTSQINSSTYHAPATVVVDLAADPQLAVFRGPQRWGYVCCSQRQSTWDTLERPGGQLPIFDLRSSTVWRYRNGAWESEVMTVAAMIAQGILRPHTVAFNPLNGRMYYVSNDNLWEM